MPTALITHPACLNHDTGPYHPECADRLRAVLAALETPEFADLLRESAPHATAEQLGRVHPANYVEAILAIRPDAGELVQLDADTAMSAGSAEAALRAAVADPAILMVSRNAGSGTRVLIDSLLRGAKPPGYANQPRSHNAVAAAIAQHRADWGVAISPVARLYGLGFLPVAPEHYDFLVVEARRQRAAVQAFIEVLRDEATRGRIRALGMEP